MNQPDAHHPSMPRDGEIVTVVETEIVESDGVTAAYEVRESAVFHNPTQQEDNEDD